MEPGNKWSNTPGFVYISGHFKDGGTNQGTKANTKKDKIDINGKPIYVIHKDGSIVRYRYERDCVKQEHTDYATIEKYIDKNWDKRNTRGIQFRSTKPF
jgi:hypothetical protein